jgi:hypothetical protein
LGELYEDQFVQQTTGFNVVDEKAEKLRQEAKLIFQVRGGPDRVGGGRE